MVCVRCSEHYHTKCRTGRKSVCEPCAAEKLGDLKAICRSGWTDRPTDRGYFLTLTGHGASKLPWDRSRCTHSAGVRCAGDLGCQVQAYPAAVWHHSLPQRWSWFVTEVRRLLPDGCDVQFAKTYEPQKRGVLHIHAMLRFSGIVSPEVIESVLRRAAALWDFGPQVDIKMVDLSDPDAVASVARYVGKYASKSADALPVIDRIDPVTAEVAHGGLRAWSASRSWGDTMKTIRARRCRYAQAMAAQPPSSAGGAAALDLNQDRYAFSDSLALVFPLLFGVLLPSVAG